MNILFDYKKRNIEKKRGPTEIRTRINGFKVQCANRYTIGPINIFIFYTTFILIKIKVKKIHIINLFYYL